MNSDIKKLQSSYYKKRRFRIGKIGKLNIKANKMLKTLFTNLNIRYCEINLEGCLHTSYLQFCHRHKRHWYRSKPELLYDYNHVILGCVKCHSKIEQDKELTKQVFLRLREGGSKE